MILKINYLKKTFDEFGLLAMLVQVYNASPYKAINDLMPGKFKEWELNNVPLNFWSKHNCQKAIIWLITEKIGPTYEYMNYNELREAFIHHGLGYMLQSKFKNSIEKALDGVKDKIEFKNMIYRNHLTVDTRIKLSQ